MGLVWRLDLKLPNLFPVVRYNVILRDNKSHSIMITSDWGGINISSLDLPCTRTHIQTSELNESNYNITPTVFTEQLDLVKSK